MQTRASTISWTLVASFWSVAIGVAASRVLWLAIVLSAFGFYALVLAVAVSGPLGSVVGSTYRQGGWRRDVLIAVFTAAAALLGFVASELALAYWDADVRATDERQKREDARDLDLARTRAQLATTHGELSAARARADAAEAKRQRQSSAFKRAAGRIATAISIGDGIRYKFEDARNTNPQQFSEEFERVHAKAIEDWRAETAMMLDGELPKLGLGANFSAVTGARVGYGDVYELTRLLACIQKLQAIQQALPAYIEQVVD